MAKMSPRAKVSPTKSNVSTEAFLLVCIKSAKEKLNVDFKQVAAILKMSEGGAAYVLTFGTRALLSLHHLFSPRLLLPDC